MYRLSDIDWYDCSLFVDLITECRAPRASSEYRYSVTLMMEAETFSQTLDCNSYLHGRSLENTSSHISFFLSCLFHMSSCHIFYIFPTVSFAAFNVILFQFSHSKFILLKRDLPSKRFLILRAGLRNFWRNATTSLGGTTYTQ
jgi:hypothetical protein